MVSWHMGSNSNVSTFTTRFGPVENTSEDTEAAIASESEVQTSQTNASNLAATIVNSRETTTTDTASTEASTTDTTTSSSSSETLSAVEKLVVAPEEPEISYDMKGINEKIEGKMKKLDELIAQKIAEYEQILGISFQQSTPEDELTVKENKDALTIKERKNAQAKLNFWKAEQKMQDKIRERANEKGALPGLGKDFAEIFNKKLTLLTNKSNQKLNVNSKDEMYKNLFRMNSQLTQYASGSTKEQIEANQQTTIRLSKAVEEHHKKANAYNDEINTLREERLDPKTSKERKAEIKTKLSELRAKKTEARELYVKIKSLNKRFGGRAHAMTADLRAKYLDALVAISTGEADFDLSTLV